MNLDSGTDVTEGRHDFDGRLRAFLHRSTAAPMPPTLTERLLDMLSHPPQHEIRSLLPSKTGAAPAIADARNRAGVGPVISPAAQTAGQRPLIQSGKDASARLLRHERPVNRRPTLADQLKRGVDD